MKPRQINGTYVAEEDRVMLRIKSEDQAEYRFWLTRLMTQKILHAIEKISIKNIAHSNLNKTLSQDVMQVMDEIQQKAIETTTDLTKPYQPANKLPLGADPQLIKEVTFINPNSSQMKIQFVLKNQTSIDIDLNMTTLSKTRLLLIELNKKAHWDVSDKHKIDQDPPRSSHIIH